MKTSGSVSPIVLSHVAVRRSAWALPAELLDTFSEWMSSSDPWLHFGYTSQECRDKLAAPGMEFLIAAVDEHSVGFLAYSSQGDLGGPYIHYVVVEQSLRSQGIGAKLIQQFLAESGDTSVYLTVSESNTKAKKLYELLSFQQIGSIPDYNKYGEAEFIMRCAGAPKRENTTRRAD